MPHKTQSQWRPKPVSEAQASLANTRNQINTAPTAIITANSMHTWGDGCEVLTREAVLEELHEVTRQYLSCPDPVEAAARRQRVQYTDENGLTEATTSAMLATTAEKRARAAGFIQ